MFRTLFVHLLIVFAIVLGQQSLHLKNHHEQFLNSLESESTNHEIDSPDAIVFHASFFNFTALELESNFSTFAQTFVIDLLQLIQLHFSLPPPFSFHI